MHVPTPILALAMMIPLLGCQEDRAGLVRPKVDRARIGVLRQAIASADTFRRRHLWNNLTHERSPARGNLSRARPALQARLPGLARGHMLREMRAVVGRARVSLEELGQLEVHPGIDDPKRRQLRYLRVHLMTLLVRWKALAPLEKYLDLMTRSHVFVPSIGQLRYRDLPGLIASTHDAHRRKTLQDARASVLRRLDRLLNTIYSQLRADSRRLGLSYFQLMELSEERDTRRLLTIASSHNHHNQKLFRLIWRSLTTGRSLRPSDLTYLLAGGEHQSSLTEVKGLEATKTLLGDLGLQLRLLEEPRRVFRSGFTTTCLPVNPPGDVRLLLRPEYAGLMAHVKLFETVGQAACYSSQNPAAPWELRAIGPHLGARTMGYLLGLIWLEPSWWRRYQGLDEDKIRELIRIRILIGMLRLKIQGMIIPMIRTILEGGPREIYQEIMPDIPIRAPSDIYKSQLDLKLGLKLTYTDSLSYIHELKDLLWLEPPFDLRAYILAHMILKKLRKTNGPEWYNNRTMGGYLTRRLCQNGSAATIRHLLSRFQMGKLKDDAPWLALRESWGRIHIHGKLSSDIK